MITELPFILVIDDHEAARYEVKRILEREGFFLLEGATGMDSLRLAREHEPDVIVLDARLPDLDGFEVCRRIKADPDTASIAVLLISPECMDSENKADVLDCAADLYLTQPVDPNELVSSVKALLRAHEAEHRAQHLARQWTVTFEAMSSGIALLDACGTVQLCNGAMARLLRRTPDDLSREEFLTLLQGAMGFDGHHVWEAMILMNRRESVEFTSGGQWFCLDIEPTFENSERPHGAVCILSCITERKQAEEVLRQANQRLVEADRRKNQLLALVAHELRDPLAPIYYAQQIINQAFPHEGLIKRQREIIDRQLGYMARLLEDLLDITRIREGKLSLNKVSLDLQQVVDQVVEALRSEIEGRCHQLILHRFSAPLWLEGDAIRLEQIVRNLMGNAIKYTPPIGRIELRLERQNSLDDSGGGWAILRVRDSGIGIDPEMLTRVFDQFTQADPSAMRSRGGLGIGLTMVRSLAQMHGGQVEAHSEGLGKGSEFVLRLPLSRESQLPISLPKCEDQQEYLVEGKDERLRILIVDDDQDTVESLNELLSLWGHDVKGAYGGPEAIQEALAFQPDVILLDIGLPEMNGYEVCRRLRQKPSLEGALLIAVTGYGREEDRGLAEASGFNQLLVKPVDLSRLRQIITIVATLRD